MTLLVRPKTRAKAVYIRPLEVRETEVMPLLKRIPMALEIDCRAFTNRVTIPFPPVGNASGAPACIPHLMACPLGGASCRSSEGAAGPAGWTPFGPSPAMSQAAEILDAYQPYVDYNATTWPFHSPPCRGEALIFGIRVRRKAGRQMSAISASKVIVLTVLYLFLPLTALTYYVFRRRRRAYEVERVLAILHIDPAYRRVPD